MPFCASVSACACFCVIYQLMTATWLMFNVWLAGLRINCAASETSQCHRVLELAPVTTENTETFSLFILALGDGIEKTFKSLRKTHRKEKQAQHI